jgi:flagellar basal-body rod protein FlgB
MLHKLSFWKTFHALESVMNIAEQRHNLIASNISNLDTPRYKAKEIDFKSTLANALEYDYGVRLIKTNSSHFDLDGNAEHGVEPYEDKSKWNGYNWVNIDREMTKLMENNLRYRTATEILLKKIAILKEVIREGGQ